jgi:hypothetical protein
MHSISLQRIRGMLVQPGLHADACALTLLLQPLQHCRRLPKTAQAIWTHEEMPLALIHRKSHRGFNKRIHARPRLRLQCTYKNDESQLQHHPVAWNCLGHKTLGPKSLEAFK